MKNKKKLIGIIIAIVILLIVLATLLVVINKSNVATKKQVQSAKVKEQEETKIQEIELVDNKYMHVEIDASGDKVPVPNWFVGSKVTGENEIDTGFVIYELNEGESKDTVEINDTNKDEAQKNRNQYVWVPVEDTSKFYGTDANGKKWGKNYSFTTGTNASNTFDEETGTYADNWSETNGVMSILSSIDYREPDVLKTYDTPYYLKTNKVSEDNKLDFLLRQQTDFNNMIDSVEKYGGFYIGRYETGDLGKEEAVVRKGNTNIHSQTWYTMYEKCKDLRGNNLNVKTGMIWGNQWDRTMMWLIESGAKSKEEVIKDSKSWGNYYNATFTYTDSSGVTSTKKGGLSTRIPTGSTEYTKANNIYDLAGNVYDWTMEADSTDSRVMRGGYYSSYPGDSRPARNRSYDSYPNNSYSYYGCRAALYIL